MASSVVVGGDVAGKQPGPPKRPRERTKALGNPGHRVGMDKDAPILLPGQVEPPKPPRPLKKDGLGLWRRAWSLAHTWLSPQTDVDHLLIVCEALDERAELRALVGRFPEDRFLRGSLRQVNKEVLDGLSSLGFNPTDRSKLGVAEVKIEDDLEALRQETG